MFDAGPQFFFNVGGGPGIGVHQFGGPALRRRPREPGVEEPQPSLRSSLIGLLPLLILFVIPLLNSLFGGGSLPSGPKVYFNGPEQPHTLHRQTRHHTIDYWVNPSEVSDFTANKFHNLDNRAEQLYTRVLNVECEREMNTRQALINEAQGWFFQDPEKMQQARSMPMRSCKKLNSMGGFKQGLR